MSVTRKKAAKWVEDLRDRYSKQAEEYEAQGALIPMDALYPYIQALDLALAALRGPTREMVERAWFRQPYTRLETWEREDGATVYSAENTCMACGCETPIGNFCHNCGAALTDEAVDIELRRWKEALDDVGRT